MEHKEQKILTLTQREKQNVTGVIRTFEAKEIQYGRSKYRCLYFANLTVRYLMYNDGTERSPNTKHGEYFKDIQQNITLVSVRQLQNSVICFV
jgi:hypothetical protein